MSTWRHAFTRELLPDGHEHWSIREVHYDIDGDDWGSVTNLGWTEPIAPAGETWMELADELARMSSECSRPVLDLTVDPPRFRSPIEIRQEVRANA